MRFSLAFLVVVLAATIASAGPAVARASAVRGRAAAIQDCSACHQVIAAQVPPAPVHNPDTNEDVAAPAFWTISAKYAGRQKALRGFIHTPAYPMREQDFLASAFNDIVAYIQSLHGKKK
jgi:cytochrome c551/c552